MRRHWRNSSGFETRPPLNNFKYFYEVFNPNIDIELDPGRVGEFLNDIILQSLAGLTKAERPILDFRSTARGPGRACQLQLRR